jgi:hypothetical protein
MLSIKYPVSYKRTGFFITDYEIAVKINSQEI